MGKLYYKTFRASDTGRKVRKFLDRASLIEKQCKELCKEFGATEKYLMSGDCILGTGLRAFQFLEIPDFVYWKKVKDWDGYYQPRLKTQFSKGVQRKIDEIEEIQSYDFFREIISFNDFFKTPGFIISGNTYYFLLESEWNHVMPIDCVECLGSEYLNAKADRY